MEIWPAYKPDTAITLRSLRQDGHAFERLRALTPGVNAANNTDPFLSFYSISHRSGVAEATTSRSDLVLVLPRPLACLLVKIESSDERTAMTGGSFSRHTLFFFHTRSYLSLLFLSLE